MAKCPLNIAYWRQVLREEKFPVAYQLWLTRTIEEGVDLGYVGKPRYHRPHQRRRTAEEKAQLEKQYSHECGLGRIICAGYYPPTGPLFPTLFVSSTYTIPKKRKIGHPQKWRLIHNLSGHRYGKAWSVNAGIEKTDFPIQYPSVATATHRLFCEARYGCVVWGRDMKEYYRHLMINPSYWWCMGTVFEKKYYVDCYCPFGARSMPAVFQRLSDAIRVIMLRRTSADALLGMLDDFLGITYRREGESEANLLRRGEEAAREFDAELLKMGISKQAAKDSPTSFEIVWLGMHFDTKANTIKIPEDKITNTVLFYQKEILEETGGFKKVVQSQILEELVGVLCHYSQCWPLGKTLLHPLYIALSEYLGTWEGKPKLLAAPITLNEDCKKSLAEWYERLTVVGLQKIFRTCKGRNSSTILQLWLTRRGKGWKRNVSEKARSLSLISPWGTSKMKVKSDKAPTTTSMSLVMVAGIQLLHCFLAQHVEKCGEIVEVRTNIGRFASYVAKQCYPKGLDRDSYILSVAIQRLLERDYTASPALSRELKAYYIY